MRRVDAERLATIRAYLAGDPQRSIAPAELAWIGELLTTEWIAAAREQTPAP